MGLTSTLRNSTPPRSRSRVFPSAYNSLGLYSPAPHRMGSRAASGPLGLGQLGRPCGGCLSTCASEVADRRCRYGAPSQSFRASADPIHPHSSPNQCVTDEFELDIQFRLAPRRAGKGPATGTRFPALSDEFG